MCVLLPARARSGHTLTSQAPHTDLPTHRTALRRPVNDAGKPTTLSLLKTSTKKVSCVPRMHLNLSLTMCRTSAKIAAMEAKLKQMQAAPLVAQPAHPSLPTKPFGPLPPADAPGADKGQPMAKGAR